MSLCKTLIDTKEVLEMEYDRGHLLNFYENIEDTKKQRDEYIEIIQQLDTKIQNDTLEYRIKSVYRILSFMHSNQEFIINNKQKFDTLITHCCNKLSGNIDGIELELDKKGDN